MQENNVCFEYNLNREEIKSALYLTNMLKGRRIRTIVQLCLCALIFVISIINIITDPTHTVSYIMIVAGILVTVMVLTVPKMEEKRAIDEAEKTTKATTVITLLDSAIEINIPSTNVKWEIDKNLLSSVLQNDIIYCLILSDNRLVVIPKRAVNEVNAKDEFERLISSMIN